MIDNGKPSGNRRINSLPEVSSNSTVNFPVVPLYFLPKKHSGSFGVLLVSQAGQKANPLLVFPGKNGQRNFRGMFELHQLYTRFFMIGND